MTEPKVLARFTCSMLAVQLALSGLNLQRMAGERIRDPSDTAELLITDRLWSRGGEGWLRYRREVRR